MHCCKVNGIKLRSHRDSVNIAPNKGKDHWAYGKTKETHPLYRWASQRMKKDNPSFNMVTSERITRSKALTYRKNPWPQESAFRNLLKQLNISFIFQHPITPYIIDFYIPHKNLCIEIDSTDKWGTERSAAAKKKDLFLLENGFTVLRINKSKLKNIVFISDIFRTYDLIV
jgi:very-short-patch-repair endonuclease